MKVNSTWLNWCREYKKYPYTETIELTHKLFLENKNISKVAKLREVKDETIERQIVILIVKGIINVLDVINLKKVNEVNLILENEKLVKLSEIKDKVSKDISWFEIKAVIASNGVEA